MFGCNGWAYAVVNGVRMGVRLGLKERSFFITPVAFSGWALC